jgi:hypothetical protein
MALNYTFTQRKTQLHVSSALSLPSESLLMGDGGNDHTQSRKHRAINEERYEISSPNTQLPLLSTFARQVAR